MKYPNILENWPTPNEKTQADYIAPSDTCRVIQVIENTISRRGSGKDETCPVRIITQYWTLDGRLIV